MFGFLMTIVSIDSILVSSCGKDPSILQLPGGQRKKLQGTSSAGRSVSILLPAGRKGSQWVQGGGTVVPFFSLQA